MKWRKDSAVILVAILTIVAFIFTLAQTNPSPRIEFPPEVSIAQGELGQLAYFHFRLNNSGGKMLQISNIRSNCSCLGFEILENHDWFRPSDIQIPSKTGKDIRVKVSVRGVPPGRSSLNKVYFQTNDPANKDCAIDFVIRQVRGGIIPIPETVVLKTNALGLTANEIVEIWDDGDTERKIEDVTAAIGSRLKIDMLPKASWPKTTVNSQLGNRICCFKVEYCPNSIESKTELIQIRIKDDPTHLETIKAYCSVEPILTSTPSVVRLPRKSENGTVFSCQMIISAEGKTVESQGKFQLPNGISIRPGEKIPGMIHLFIEMAPSLFAPGGLTRTDFAELDLRVDGVPTRHRIPIEFHQDETGHENK